MTIFRVFKLGADAQQLDYYQEVGEYNLITSIEQEPGTLAMYACHLPEQVSQTVVVEVYQDQAAYETHVASEQFQAFVKMAEQVLTSREIFDLEAQLLLEKTETMRVVGENPLSVRLAEVQIEPDQVAAFAAVVTDEMKQAMAKEEGVLVMYAGSLKTEPERWFFFEVYADEAAYESHRQTEHFMTYIRETADLVVAKQLTVLTGDILVNKGGLRNEIPTQSSNR